MYEAFGDKDEERLRRVIHPAVAWNQCPGFPGGASRRGIDEVLTHVLHGNSTTWTGFGVQIDELIESGSRVVALGSYSGVHHRTGKSMQALFAHVYEVNDGRIERFDQITDTWPMVEATQD